jgi:hypothetical protein
MLSPRHARPAMAIVHGEDSYNYSSRWNNSYAGAHFQPLHSVCASPRPRFSLTQLSVFLFAACLPPSRARQFAVRPILHNILLRTTAHIMVGFYCKASPCIHAMASNGYRAIAPQTSMSAHTHMLNSRDTDSSPVFPTSVKCETQSPSSHPLQVPSSSCLSNSHKTVVKTSQSTGLISSARESGLFQLGSRH